MSFTLCELYLNKVVTKKRLREKSNKTRVTGVTARKRGNRENNRRVVTRGTEKKPTTVRRRSPRSLFTKQFHQPQFLLIPQGVQCNYYHSGKEFAHQHRRCQFNPWDGKIHWRRKWQLTPVF